MFSGVKVLHLLVGVKKTNIIGCFTMVEDGNLFPGASQIGCEGKFATNAVGIRIQVCCQDDVLACRENGAKLFEFFCQGSFNNKKGVIESSTTPFSLRMLSIIR